MGVLREVHDMLHCVGARARVSGKARKEASKHEHACLTLHGS